MARMYPIKEDISEMPYSESRVYDALSRLDSSFSFRAVDKTVRQISYNLEGKRLSYSA